MKSNYKQKVLEAYSGGGEVNRAAKTGEYGMEFIYTKRALDPYITPCFLPWRRRKIFLPGLLLKRIYGR